MHHKKIVAAIVLMAASHSVFAGSGVVLGSTRVVYDANNKEASITVNNRSADQYFLVQSWVDDKSGNKKVPFAITPPLFRLNANKENMLRIIKTADTLPADRESIYWVNVKAIPPAPEGEAAQNVLQLAIKTRVKLFYRPKGLPGKAVDAPAALQWAHQGNTLVVTNPTPYSVTLNAVQIAGKNVPDVDLVMPKETTTITLPSGVTGNSVAFTTINDFGGISPEITAQVK